MFVRLILFVAAALLIAAPQYAPCAELSNRANIQKIWANKSGLHSGFTFIVVGDSREGDRIYKAILEKAREYDPLFIINTGDIVSNGTLAEFAHYEKLIAHVDIPMVTVVGNHEVVKGFDNYRRLVGDTDWFFDYGDYRFIAIDNARGNFSPETMAFLGKYLKTHKQCFVFFHRPPSVDRWKVHSMNADSKGGRGGAAMDLIAAANVKAVFLGHIHLFDEMIIDGIPYIISAGGGAGLYKKFGFGKPEHGFVVARVSPDGFSYEWIPVK